MSASTHASDASSTTQLRSTTRLLAGPVRHSVRVAPRDGVSVVLSPPSLTWSLAIETPRAASGEDKRLLFGSPAARRRRASLTHAAVQQVFGRGPAVALRDARSQREVARTIGSRAVPLAALVSSDPTPSPSHALISELVGQRRREARQARKAARAALSGVEGKEVKGEVKESMAHEAKRESKDVKDASALSHAAVAAKHGSKRRSFAPTSPASATHLRSHADVAAALGTRHAAKRLRDRSLSPEPSSPASSSATSPRMSHAEIARAFGRRASLGGASTSSSSFVRLSHSDIARAFGTRHRRASRTTGDDSSSATSASELSDDSDASDSSRSAKRARTAPFEAVASAPLIAE